MEGIGLTTIGAILGGLFTGGFAHWIDSSAKARAAKLAEQGKTATREIDLNAALRDDLWTQRNEYEKNLKVCQTECDDWRQRYNQARDEFYEMRRQVKRYEAQYGPLDASDAPAKRSRPT